jgi:sugar lactone lactonase YvrE
VPRGWAIFTGLGIATAACNILTGVSTLDEAPDGASLRTDAGDAGVDAIARDAKAPHEGGTDTASDAGVDAPCDDATLGTDPQNCGMCGRSCGVEDCVDASCTPRVLVSGLNIRGPIAVDKKYVYFITTNSVDSVPLDGGSVLELGTGLPSLNYLAVDSKYVYLSVEPNTPPNYEGPILRVPLTGGTATTLAANRVGPNGIAVSGGIVYWAQQGDGGANGAIVSIPSTGGTAKVVGGPQFGPEQLALDSENAYFSNFDWGGTTVVQAPLAGGAPITLATVNSPLGIAQDTSNVYFADIADGGGVYQVPKGGGGGVMELAPSPFAVFLASDGKSLYWTDASQGTLNKVPVGGGTTTTLLSGLGSPVGIAIDETSVYCNETDGGLIVRVNK